ncbi:PREDICTED: uncharacterized protein LOC101310721 isoform 5 [Fragaria vesca subsp. vesca]|uniref:uncharacterized protein LOC101310721 isoform X1 n=1 Tax=Fragaria vesca subsp. vesca TaxID=101020 RepID=UPI0002C35091|nr:PREDICTED: uncharacterized protein LOC101310721 isoform X1 [Fragaria vesca subsp. vesca]XP_011467682.1 PREDICTED: uncharacterized protein LOC101310721 isoform X1 [Fragaria vesca subsp. vesca]
MVEITGPSSRSMNTTIGDLPEAVLVEILGRLPCYKYIGRCKCVSKHWCTFMSHPSFIRRFLYFQSYGKQPFMTRTLINCQGEEFLARISSSFKALTPLFKRLMNFHHLKEEPVVVGSYNDLVLCCASQYYQRDYYICNPYTFKWVTLPPPPQVTKFTGAGIFCDLPYYECKKNDLGRHDIQLNADYKCRVVRIIFPRGVLEPQCEFKVQIFSSETGVWRESIVLSPSRFYPYEVKHRISFAYNGMLYWLSDDGDFLIGLDLFMMDNRTSASISSTSSSMVEGDASDHYEFLFTELDGCKGFTPGYLGFYKGCMQIGDYHYGTHTVNAWEFHEEFHSGSGKLLLEQRKRVYSLDLDMIPDDNYYVDLVGFDPNNDGNEGEGILYLLVINDHDNTYGDIFMCNICTGKFMKIFENHPLVSSFFTVAVPWWPTPVPRLPEREANPLILARLD